MKRRFALILLLLLISASAFGCGQDEPEKPTPTGDPAQAARAFMSALLNGQVESCVTLSSINVRETMRRTCQNYADAESVADLSSVEFVELDRQDIYALVEMQGSYMLSAYDFESESRAQRLETTAIRILMIYEGEFWRFDDFVNEE